MRSRSCTCDASRCVCWLGRASQTPNATANQRVTQLAADIVGSEALTGGTSWSYELMRARGNSIEGGTTEVLKNIVAERVLGLPRLKTAA
jgi:hypothetical protein